MVKLVLLRHGESLWNLENRFTGWTDVDLTPKGEQEAQNSGKILVEEGFDFDLIYTSVLTRAIRTMEICLSEMQIDNVPIKYNWRLNERHYGALQGLNKAETAAKFGDEQVLIWRRSYDTQPPALEISDKRWSGNDPTYANINQKDILGDLRGYHVLDLFAGSGILGFEAASRGAESITFVESSMRIISLLKINGSYFKETEINYSRTDALKYLNDSNHFDLILADPPYNYENLDLLIESCKTKLKKNRYFILESSPQSYSISPTRVKEYGDTQLTFWKNEL